ncbi:MAG: hypothetical protein LBT67_00690 [Holosporaceae bacterium]|jgi:hypothetical protein|nr:hypothetical protein [Holosporaceae bacterium]
MNLFKTYRDSIFIKDNKFSPDETNRLIIGEFCTMASGVKIADGTL